MVDRETLRQIARKLKEDFGNVPALNLMAGAIFGEARGEPFIGKVAVGYVILNRALDKTSLPIADAIKAVVLRPFQFSSFLPHDPNYQKVKRIVNRSPKCNKEKDVWTECYVAAYIVWHKLMEDPTLGATHYFASSIPTPKWAKNMQITTMIGNHIFLKP